jgi:FkbM family methyltransferase
MNIKTYEIRGQEIKAAIPSDYIADYWERVQDGRWEKDAFDVFDRYVDGQTVCFDLGAYIGFTCTYLAKRSKATHGLEPDPEAYKYLEATVAANELPGLHIYPYAAGGMESTVDIKSSYSGGNSGSSLLLKNPKTSWKVRMVDLNAFIDERVASGDKVFLKMDIEGYEYTLLKAILPTLQKHKVTIFLALHPQIVAGTVTGNSIVDKIRRRIGLVSAHNVLLKLKSVARSVQFAHGIESSDPIGHIYREILLKGQLPEDQKELIIQC